MASRPRLLPGLPFRAVSERFERIFIDFHKPEMHKKAHQDLIVCMYKDSTGELPLCE